MSLPQLPPSLMQIVTGTKTFDFYVDRDPSRPFLVVSLVRTSTLADDPVALKRHPDGGRNEWKGPLSARVTNLEAMEIIGRRILDDFDALPKTYPIKALDTDRARAAEDAFRAHSFGEGVAVHAYRGWDRTSTGSEWSREAHASSATVAMSVVKFSVHFEPGSDKVIETYAIDRFSGRAWGEGFALDSAKATVQPIQAFENVRLAIADRAFHGYDFGDGVTVEAVNGWESSADSIARAVFVRTDDDAPGADTTKIRFVAAFARSGELLEAYAMDRKGSIWGSASTEASESADSPRRAPSPAA